MPTSACTNPRKAEGGTGKAPPLIFVSGDRMKAAIWRLDEGEVGGQTIRLQDIPARTGCNDVLEWVGEEVLKEYKNLAHNRGLQAGDRIVRQVGAGSDGEAVMDRAGAEGGESLNDDDHWDEPAETAICAFVATNLHKASNRGSCNPLQHAWKEREKKEPSRVGDPPLCFAEFVRAHPQGCFVCYGWSSHFQHDHRTFPIHKADTESYRKAHGTKKRMSANIRGAKVEMSKDELSKLMMVGTELAKEIQEITRGWEPKPGKDKDKNKDNKGKGWWKKKGDAMAEVAAEEDTPTTDTLSGAPAAKGPSQGGRRRVPRSALPHPRPESSIPPDVYIPSGMPGAKLEAKNSRNGQGEWRRDNRPRRTYVPDQGFW